jgi:glycosyltransferase involved in cell wall biosynthesis
MTGCRQCPQLAGTIDPDYAAQVFASKAGALRHLADDQMIITAPSKWILAMSRDSAITGRFRHVHIENPGWQPADSGSMDEARVQLGLPPDKKIVVFASDNLRNPRKGVALLFQAAQQMQNRNDVHLVGLGRRADMPSGLSVSFPGFVSAERELRKYFTAADAFVIPSPAENSPLVLIEALTCGTPVVAFPVGGIPELVDESNGVLARDVSASSLAEALYAALFERDFRRSDIRQRSAKYAPAVVLQKYHSVYRELVAA